MPGFTALSYEGKFTLWKRTEEIQSIGVLLCRRMQENDVKMSCERK